MARRSWDGEIDELPAEILSYNVKEIPRSTLKDIANRLNADSISAGNWESLAEKLGFTQNSVLENLTQQAKVQNTYPGLLMLQEWSRRSGSTAHVLLHALREIQREDAVAVLVDKLHELHTMQLLVSIQDGEGSQKFLRVPTQKSAPLHASLDNTLQKPPYWYDIVGPRYDISWNTPSGVLQGTQLMLRLRVEPSENSMSQIYGTTASMCQPPPNYPLALNIPPEQCIPIEAPLLNNLSTNGLAGAQRDGSVPQCPPPGCFPLSTPTVRGLAGPQQHHDSVQYHFEPGMTRTGPQPPPQCPQRFPNFDTLMSSTASDFEFSAPPMNVCSLLGSGSVAFLTPSCTGLKEPPEQLGNTGHDETLLKERADPLHAKPNMAAAAVKPKYSHDNVNPGAIEHDELAFMEGVEFTETSQSPVTASSFMQPVYVTHDRVIQFCNNPTSPRSLGSNSSSVSSASALELQSAETTCVAAQQQRVSADEPRRMDNSCDYVPLEFMEQQSKNYEKSTLTGQSEEETMQTECSESGCSPAEGMNNVGGNGLQWHLDSCPKRSAAVSVPTYSNVESSKPKPCTYSTYRPGSVNSQQCTDFQPRPLPHSVSLNSDAGYLDMSGRPSSDSSPHPSHNRRAVLTGIHACMSMDSYMNTQMPDLHPYDEDTAQLSDSTGRNMSTPNLDSLLHCRSRNPLPVGGDVFQPRDRRPLTQDHELLLDDPDPEYTYIDAASVSAAEHRRSSEGALPSAGRKHHGMGRHGAHRNSEPGQSQCDVKLAQGDSVSPAELQQIPGWNTNITERTVEHEMSRYVNDDGNFIVWRYAVGGKYVISVSHLRSIRHYAVYESEREGRVHYYIFPKGARFTSLAHLIQHCQKNGMVEPTKTFKTPDGKQAHQSNGSNGRFSHVRLRFPIPARRN